MKRYCSVLVIGLVFLASSPAEARRLHLPPEQKARLEQAQTILLDVVALTERGAQDAGPLAASVKQRLEDIGYTVTTDRSQPHDVEVKVKCEEQKTVTGTSPTGGDADLADAPARLWQGPACLFTYLLNQKDMQWNKEIRAAFPDARQAAQKAQVDDAGQFALDHLRQQLKEYDFPVLLSAEWGQMDRLLKLLDNPKTSKLRKVKILSVLSDVQAEEALPHLTKLLENTDLQQETINALAGAGAESIPMLIDLFQNSRHTGVRAEAAKALGNIAAKTGDPRPIPPLVRYVSSQLPDLNSSEDIDFPLMTEVVWAIGKLRWDPAIKPIAELQDKVWLIHDNSKEMAELREATSWTYKSIDLQDAAMLNEEVLKPMLEFCANPLPIFLS